MESWTNPGSITVNQAFRIYRGVAEFPTPPRMTADSCNSLHIYKPTLFEVRMLLIATTASRAVGLALYGRLNRKPVGSPEAVPFRSAPPTSGILSFAFVCYDCRDVLLRAVAQEVTEGKKVTDNARAHQKSGKRTQYVTYEEHFVSETVPLLKGAPAVV
eukprot:394622-Pleurochrysis_carterae.AAC.1